MTKKHAKKWLNKEMEEKKNEINIKFHFLKKLFYAPCSFR